LTWRIEVNHVTDYRYERPVVASYNEARVTPLDTPSQSVVDANLAVSPRAEVFAYRDYWGSLVHAFDLHEPHGALVVTSRAVVETGLGLTTGAGADRDGRLPEAASWEDLRSAATEDRFYEFLAPCPLVSPLDFAEVAAAIRAACADPAEAAARAVEWARSQLEYASKSTGVTTTATQAWSGGRGVCQDFTHVTLGVLRAIGVPARYVSGYFYPKPAGTIGAHVVGESHAWVEAWTAGWTAYDPTNLVEVGERHIVVARGRDYSDVAPLRGVYSGPAGSSACVEVVLTRRA
jgi:transglutaminase-like putative cysteine protease